MKIQYMIIIYFIILICDNFLNVNAIRKKSLRSHINKVHNHHENIQGNTLSNFEIVKEKNNVSNIELNSSKFFDILASTSLMRNSGGAMSQGPVYRVVQNIHDNNENIGASLVFVIFLLLVVFILFFIFYFIFKNHVKHVKYMNS